VDAKLASYERGRDVAKRAIEMAPRSPEAHLWYAANLGRWAVTKGKLQAAFLLSTLRQEIQTVLEGIDGIRFVYFDHRDVVRHDLVSAIVRAYDRVKPSRGAPPTGAGA
jgi:hypothetical protein